MTPVPTIAIRRMGLSAGIGVSPFLKTNLSDDV
jgi:hypothetical protein